MTVPNKPRPENRHRSIRVEHDLWEAAKRRAPERRRIVVTLTESDGKDAAIRKFLERYVR